MSCLPLELGEKRPHVFCEFYFCFFQVLLIFIYLFIYSQGFTIGGQPILNSFLKVKGTFGTSISAKVYSPPTILIHLRLESVIFVAHFKIVEQLLSEYYSADNPLTVRDLPFDLGNDRDAAKWSSDLQRLVAGLPLHRHVIIFVTTHSDPESGDLWLGKDKEGCDIATNVSNVSRYLIISY